MISWVDWDKAMIIKNRLFFLIVILFFCFCERIFDPHGSSDDVLYFNSFESTSDLSGWTGLTEDNLVNDPSPSGGSKSVRISGGCIVPHAELSLDPPGKDQQVSLSFYGKNLMIGGAVELFVGKVTDQSQNVWIAVTDTSWTFYTSETQILWFADSTLTLWLNSGGIAPSAMLIDDLKLFSL